MKPAYDLRVLSVIHFPVFGGPMNRNAFVAQELAREGVHTTVVLPSDGVEAARRIADRGVAVRQIPLHRLRSLRSPAAHFALASSFRSEVEDLRRLIRELEIDVVLVNGSANPHAARAARLEGVPVVWQLLDTFPPPVFLRVVMPMITKWADVIMTNGMTTAAMHPGAMEFPGPLITFGPCLPVERFTPEPSMRAEARAELGIGEDDVVVGNVNNLNPMKGHQTFLAAAARLRRTHDVRFVILGAENDPVYAQSLRARAESLGLRPGNELVIREGGSQVHRLAQAFDVFWLTSEPRSEGMSTSLAEAQCLGLPVVATRTGAVHECMQDGSTGFLVAPHDVDDIAAKSRLLLDDPDLRHEFGQRAAAFVRANFSVRATAQRHLEAYQAARRVRSKSVAA